MLYWVFACCPCISLLFYKFATSTHTKKVSVWKPMGLKMVTCCRAKQSQRSIPMILGSASGESLDWRNKRLRIENYLAIVWYIMEHTSRGIVYRTVLFALFCMHVIFNLIYTYIYISKKAILFFHNCVSVFLNQV